jgi:lichenan operon transcriptional antiterminator
VKAKYIKLLQYLNEQDNWVSSTKLAEKFNLSKRTIKSYIADIQINEPDLIISSNKGYRVKSSNLITFFSNIEISVPETPTERIAYLLLKLISTEKSLSIYDLAEELFISESTLLSDAKKLKKQCSDLSLDVKLTKDTLQLVGTEKAKRQLIHSTLLSELNNNFVDITKLQESFIDFDLDYIKEIIAEIFSDYDFFTNDYALTNIVIHLAIAVDRMKGDFQSSEADTQSPKSIHPTVLKIAKKIADKVSERYAIRFPEEEIRDLAILISANGTSVNFTQISQEELETVTDKHCLDLVKKILAKVDELYFIDSNEPEFFIRFALHIKNLLYRLDNGYSCRNPMTKTLKKECPLIYDCAVQVSHVIRKEIGYTISEDEIAYIAFHLGYALEIQKQRTNKINCTVLVPHYYNMNIQVVEKLQKSFSDDLEIQNIITDEKELKYVDTELIVSAVKLKQVIAIPYVIINPFFTLENRQQITDKIFDIKEKKRKDQFIKNFLSIVDEKRFIYTTEPQSSFELLKKLCNQMEEEGIVDGTFYSQVIEREQLSSTAFGYVAIPHSLTMNANRTGISIVVNPNGIKWGASRVTLVFLISINYHNRNVFREIFDDLAMICTDEQTVHQLSAITTFDEFLSALTQCVITNKY